MCKNGGNFHHLAAGMTAIEKERKTQIEKKTKKTKTKQEQQTIT